MILHHHHLLLLLLLLAPPPLHPAQYFSVVPEYTETNPGSSVVLNCVVSDKSSLSQCVWQQDGTPVRMQEGKYEWSGQRDAGDCSIRILKSNLVYDDGMWECQVSQSSYQTNDGLSSSPAQLVVRHPPTQPRIYADGQTFASQRELAVRAGREQVLFCESRGGNPAPALSWTLGDTLLPSTQRNESQSEEGKQWTAISKLVYTFSKADNGRQLKCSVFHLALTSHVREASLSLDIQYPPSVRLERNAELDSDVEDGLDPFRLRCIADGNPRPDIVWRKLGRTSIISLEETLRFEPVRKSDTGTYICLARNELGASDEISARLDVKYPPRNIKTDPETVIDVKVGEETSLRCEGDGSPEPQFEWQQKLEDGDTSMVMVRRRETVLNIRNVTYEHEGLWRCSARNTIKGQERRNHSDTIKIEVSGRPLPRALAQGETRGVAVAVGEEATLSLQFCSDPPPRQLAWHWGSLSLEEGRSRGRFSASQRISGSRKDCYKAELKVKEVARPDERTYHLQVDNGSGTMRLGAQLTVSDPVSMVTVLAISISLLVIIVFCCICTVAMRRRHTCCFTEKRDIHTDNIRIERRTETAESETDRFSEDQNFSSASKPVRTKLVPAQPRLGIGQEVTYQGHAGVGRPVPSPLYSSPHRKTPQNSDRTQPASSEDDAKLISPKKVKGTPTMYADLQFPKSSNSGDMKRRALMAEREKFVPRQNRTEYGRIVFNPAFAERANL